jgi:hypothetical protein
MHGSTNGSLERALDADLFEADVDVLSNPLRRRLQLAPDRASVQSLHLAVGKEDQIISIVRHSSLPDLLSVSTLDRAASLADYSLTAQRSSQHRGSSSERDRANT